MARDYVIEVVGAHRAERGVLSVERELARELRQATRQTRSLLHAAALENAPTPRGDGGEVKGDGVGSAYSVPGGLRRFAGRATGGEPLVALTYEVTLFVDDVHTLAAAVETGTGLYGPEHKKYPIYPTAGKALLLEGWGGNRSEPFRGGRGSERSGRGSSLGPAERKPIFDHVVHPGIHPRPFLAKTARDHATEIDRLYDHAVAQAMRGI